MLSQNENLSITFEYCVCFYFVILHVSVIILVVNEILEIDVWWMLFSSMKRAVMMFSSKKQYGYGLGNWWEATGYRIWLSRGRGEAIFGNLQPQASYQTWTTDVIIEMTFITRMILASHLSTLLLLISAISISCHVCTLFWDIIHEGGAGFWNFLFIIQEQEGFQISSTGSDPRPLSQSGERDDCVSCLWRNMANKR